MTYFRNVNTLEELRKQYKELLKKFHPDNPNGSTETTQKINQEYEKLFKLLKDRHDSKRTSNKEEKTSYYKDLMDYKGYCGISAPYPRYFYMNVLHLL